MRGSVNGKLLDKAVYLFKRRRYAAAADLLSPYLLTYGDSYLYFKLMTVVSLIIGDWSGASAYLKTAVRLEKRTDSDLRIAEAVIRLQAGETAEAYGLLFDLERNERWGNFARELLEISRNTENRQALTEILEKLVKKRLSKIRLDGICELPNKPDRLVFPGVDSLRRFWPALTALAVFVVLLFAGTGIYFAASALSDNRDFSTERFNGENIVLTREDRLAVYDIETRYFLSDGEIERSFERMKDYYRRGDDNMTQREINRLKESNAAVDVKDKASAFERLLSDNRSENTGTPFTYDEVSRDPFLYDKTVVVWRGAAANLSVTQTSLTFDLLVGNENKNFLEGTVPVFVDYGVKITEGEPYEVEGEITVGVDGHFRLHALSIRRIQIN